MALTSQNKPDFIKRAKLVSENKTPDFLSRSKLVSAPEEQYVSDEQVQKDIERSQAMNTSRALEAVFGLPSDLINLAGGLLGFDLGLPGSQKLQEISENVTGGYTKPKDEFENRLGETMQDIALFALPGAKHYSIARNFGIPIVANLAKEGIKYAGGEEKSQAAGKIGSMLLLDLLFHRKNLGSAKEYASGLFQKADELIPKGLSIKSTNLESSLDKLDRSLRAGGERPSTADAITKIGEIKKEIKDGKIDLKGLVAYRPSINELIDKYKGFDIQVKPAIREKIIYNLNQVKREVINAAEEYGSKYNPEYLNLSKAANESYAAYAQSNKIANFIEKHAGSKLVSSGAKALLGLGLTGSAGLLGSTLGGALGAVGTAGAALGYKIFKTILRSRSPTLRNHYFKIIEGAANGNTGQVVKNAKALDKELLNLDITGEINEE